MNNKKLRDLVITAFEKSGVKNIDSIVAKELQVINKTNLNSSKNKVWRMKTTGSDMIKICDLEAICRCCNITPNEFLQFKK